MSESEIIVQKYNSLLKCVDGLHCSYKKAVKIVGGEKRLERLMTSEKVRYSKPSGSPNTMWRFNMSDIIQNVKPLAQHSSK